MKKQRQTRKADLRYGQIVRATNGVYIIWDLAAKNGYTAALKPRPSVKGHLVGYRVGELIIFDRQQEVLEPIKWNLTEKQLPEGITPLITVTIDPIPPTPDNHSAKTDYNNNLKRAIR